MKRIHYCYLLTRALPDGGCRYYVGIRTCPEGTTPETDTSYMGSGDAIKAAVDLYGRAAFSKSIVDVFDTIAEAKALERALVGLTTANSPYSYNLMEGGGSGGLPSNESKARMSATRKAKFRDDPDFKARNAEMARARFDDPDYKAKHDEAHRTPQFRANMSAAASAKYDSDPDYRARRTAANRAKGKDPAFKSKLRASRLAQYADADYRAKHMAATTKANRRPESRAKNSAAKRAEYARMTAEERAARGRAISESKCRARAERERAA
ncbi:MAG: hypothetical protein IT453_07725 [Planctomycetes bacterium]|nr:hypothetical protein [Planctomycetota bacterium]